MGGIPAAYDPNFYRVNKEHNPYGCYELNVQQTKEKEYIFNYPNQVIKVMFQPLLRIITSEHKYKILFMFREPEDIIMSQEVSLRSAHPLVVHPWAYWREMNRAIFKLNIMSNVSVFTLEYDYMVNNPLDAFKALSAKGWPIKPEKAAKGIDRSLYKATWQTQSDM